MNNLGYLDKILNEYQKTFDIYRDYKIGDEVVYAYGYFNSHSEKYLLVKEVQLWETKAFEHIFFIQKENINISTLERIFSLIPNYIEPQLVRNNKKYPEKNHMYSYITLVILTNGVTDTEVIKKVQKYRFEKTYLFSIRGYVQSRVILIDMDNKNIFTNKLGKKMEKLYNHLIK